MPDSAIMRTHVQIRPRSSDMVVFESHVVTTTRQAETVITASWHGSSCAKIVSPFLKILSTNNLFHFWRFPDRKLPAPPVGCDTFWHVAHQSYNGQHHIDCNMYSHQTVSIHAAGAHVRGDECVDDFRALPGWPPSSRDASGGPMLATTDGNAAALCSEWFHTIRASPSASSQEFLSAFA